MSKEVWQTEENSLRNLSIRDKQWFFLLEIACLKRSQQSSLFVPDIYNKLGISQTTVSRRIIELEERGYIERNFVNKCGEIILTERAFHALEIVYNQLGKIFQSEKGFNVFSGALSSGMGEGAHYIKNTKYLKQFYQRIGFFPYFGTLNLKIHPEIYDLIETRLKSFKSVVVKGFQDKSRTYGDVTCFLVQLWVNNNPQKRVEGALLRIQRTSHDPYVLEFISEQFLRDYFSVEDGDPINFEFLIDAK